MSKAYRCDRCNCLYDGESDMQLEISALVGTDETSRILGIRYSPETRSPLHMKDLCENCRKDFVFFWKLRKVPNES